MRRCAGVAAVACLFLFCLIIHNGAGVPETSTVSIDRKGQISAWFVEDFAEDYYSLAELTGMAVREAAEYNAGLPGKKAAVTVEKVGLLPENSGKIMVRYWFDGWESYTDFNGQGLFYGTVEEAVRKGFGTDAMLKSVADGGLSSGDWLSRGAGDGLGLEAGKYVVITDVKANIYCPKKVTHISGGVSVNEDGSIDTSGAEGTAYIMMK